jgi:lipid-A-disaccharide synthase-like uncharacterized protein
MCNETNWWWLALGFFGQALFSARFLIQWIYSEKNKKSMIPTAFWFFSIGGGVVLLSYAIHRQDPVIIAGQAGGLLIYARNLWLVFAEKKRAKSESNPVS